MSFRLFVYYCALSGGCAAFVGWLAGRFTTGADPVGEAGVKGFFLGMFVALALSLIDVFWNLSGGKTRGTAAAIGSAVLIGATGALMAAMIGQLLYAATGSWLFLLFGWALTGLLIGVSLGAFDFLMRTVHAEDVKPALAKIQKGMLGGTVGGVLGGLIFLLLRIVWTGIFKDKQGIHLWSPSATGFVALGACIGLAIGLAQVILKEAWVKVEKGHRAGRELILSRPVLTIGRAETCDIGLFGDSSIERLHARILLQGKQYFVEDAGTPGGTFLNGERIHEPIPLKQADQIRVGNCILSFGERRKSRKATR
jgi:FHA domain